MRYDTTISLLIRDQTNKKLKRVFEFSLVRTRGLEPPCLAALAPQTSVSTISPRPRNELCYLSIIN